MCTSPLYRLPVKYRAFVSLPDKDFVNGGAFLSYDQITRFNLDFSIVQRIPCGQCIQCRLNYSRSWAIRCMLEANQYEFNYFVTLTYAESALPRGNFLSADDGLIYDSTLRRSDLTNFLKRLRENSRVQFNHTGIRCFYCGEYGELRGRPHYHLILFNMPELKDLRFSFSKKGKNGDIIGYTSEFIEKAWCFPHTFIPLGIHSVQDVSFDTCAYTARYVLKKQKGKSIDYANSLLDDPSFVSPYSDLQLRANVFCGMSRRPGLSFDYYQDHKDEIYFSDSVIYNSDFKAFLSKPPRYFDKLYDLEYPEQFSLIKEKRSSLSSIASAASSELYSEDYLERISRESDLAERTLLKSRYRDL